MKLKSSVTRSQEFADLSELVSQGFGRLGFRQKMLYLELVENLTRRADCTEEDLMKEIENA